MTFTDNPSRDYERFCDAQDHGAGDEPDAGGVNESLDARASAEFLRGFARDNANPRGKFWDSEEPVRHEELYREDLEEPQDDEPRLSVA